MLLCVFIVVSIVWLVVVGHGVIADMSVADAGAVRQQIPVETGSRRDVAALQQPGDGIGSRCSAFDGFFTGEVDGISAPHGDQLS